MQSGQAQSGYFGNIEAVCASSLIQEQSGDHAAGFDRLRPSHLCAPNEGDI